jgi:predicted nucleic acid-binding Zn ribbon protein
VSTERNERGATMNSIVYLVGAIVIIVAVLSFFGLR